MVYSVRQHTDFTTALLTFKLPLQSTRVKVLSFTPIRKKYGLLCADIHEFVPISRTQFYPNRKKSVEYMANFHLR
jgi:hypothetical protein